MTEIYGYHAHIYFDGDTVEQARVLCETARDQFTIRMGRVHERNVGPHPRWSCQLAFPPGKFSDVVPWLATHRNGLIVFIHTETGDDLRDHTDHAMWMGEMLALNLDALK